MPASQRFAEPPANVRCGTETSSAISISRSVTPDSRKGSCALAIDVNSSRVLSQVDRSAVNVVITFVPQARRLECCSNPSCTWVEPSNDVDEQHVTDRARAERSRIEEVQGDPGRDIDIVRDAWGVDSTQWPIHDRLPAKYSKSIALGQMNWDLLAKLAPLAQLTPMNEARDGLALLAIISIMEERLGRVLCDSDEMQLTDVDQAVQWVEERLAIEDLLIQPSSISEHAVSASQDARLRTLRPRPRAPAHQRFESVEVIDLTSESSTAKHSELSTNLVGEATFRKHSVRRSPFSIAHEEDSELHLARKHYEHHVMAAVIDTNVAVLDHERALKLREKDEHLAQARSIYELRST